MACVQAGRRVTGNTKTAVLSAEFLLKTTFWQSEQTLVSTDIVSDCGPALHRDTNEDGEHGVEEVVEIHQSILGTRIAFTELRGQVATDVVGSDLRAVEGHCVGAVRARPRVVHHYVCPQNRKSIGRE